jgi:hypothetical protein
MPVALKLTLVDTLKTVTAMVKAEEKFTIQNLSAATRR